MEFLGIRTKSGAIVQPNSGEEMIRKFDFAYSTPGLTTGVVVYTPTAGDILLDAWIEIDTAFNGTTPQADISQYVSGVNGWFNQYGPSPVDLTEADGFHMDSGGILSGTSVARYHAAGPTPDAPIPSVSLADALGIQVSAGAGAFTTVALGRAVPAKFVAGIPVKLVVTQDGLRGGTATGATQGAGTVYFLTGTPQ